MKKNFFTAQEWEQINKLSACKAGCKPVAAKPVFTGVHAFFITFSITLYVLCVLKAYGVLF